MYRWLGSYDKKVHDIGKKADLWAEAGTGGGGDMDGPKGGRFSRLQYVKNRMMDPNIGFTRDP